MNIDGVAWPSPKTVQKVLRCGRAAREKAETELLKKGLLKLEHPRDAKGRWGRRDYIVIYPKLHPPDTTSAQKKSSG